MVTYIDTPTITPSIEEETYPDAYGLRRPRSQSLDSGAPLVPPPLSSALIREELSSGFCNCHCGENCCCKSQSRCIGQEGVIQEGDEDKNTCCTCCTCYIQPSSVVIPFLLSGSNVNPILASDQAYTQLYGSGASSVHVRPATNSRKMQKRNYHSRKYE